MRILVTGLNGLIGWHSFIAAARVCETWGTYRRKSRGLTGPKMLNVDLDDPRDIRNMLEKIQPTHIIHTRSMCDLDVCETFPELTHTVNVRGTELLVEEAEKIASVRMLCYISTDHVFDGEEGSYSEIHAPSPKHVYGRTKLLAEQVVARSSIPSLIVRPGLVIGQSVQGNKGPRDWLLSRIRKGKPSHLFFDEWRSPVGAEALAARILRLLRIGKAGLFHVAGDVRINRYDLALDMVKKEGLPTDNVMTKPRSKDAWYRIRPRDLTLKSIYLKPEPFEYVHA